MTEPQTLLPIAAAMQEAVAQLAAQQASSSPEGDRPNKDRDFDQERMQRERDADRLSIKGAFKRAGGGEAGRIKALQVGRAFGWSDDDVLEAINPKPKPAKGPRPADGYEHAHREADAADGGGGDREPPPADADGSSDPDGEGWTKKKNPVKPLPDSCPVIPLGKSGGVCWYLCPKGELRGLKAKDHNAPCLRELFGPALPWCWNNYPKFNANFQQTGWKVDELAESLMKACGDKPVFNPMTRIRGVGGWRDNAGSLILHAGDAVLIDGQWLPPGEHGGYIYPADDDVPRPTPEPAPRTVAKQLLDVLDSWNWRGEAGEDGKRIDWDGSGHALASILKLGWLASSLAGAALAFRPVLWLTGDAGDGKTTLIELVQLVLSGGFVHASDATESGVSSTLGYSTKAVLLDEAEDEGNTRRVHALIKLARQAASGGSKLRGSSDHQAHAFNAKSSFMFGSIIVPSLPPADASRIMVLKLKPLVTGSARMKLDADQWKHVGAGLRRRLVDGWPRWPETFEAYRAGLAEHGYNPRGLDQVGTLLAMADLMRFDGLPDADTVMSLCAAVASQRKAEDYQPSNTQSMLNHLLSIPLDVFRGGDRMTVGKLVARAAGIDTDDKGAQSYRSCQEALTAWNIHVDGLGDRATVVLPYLGEGLRRLFDGTHWRGEPGVKGGWAQAMERLEGAEAVNSRRFNGRGWRVNIRTFLMLADGETLDGGMATGPATSQRAQEAAAQPHNLPGLDAQDDGGMPF